MSLRRVAMSFFRVFVPGVVIPFVVVLCRCPMGLGSPFMMLGSLVVFVLRHNQLQFGPTSLQFRTTVLVPRPETAPSNVGRGSANEKKDKRPHFQSERTLPSRCCLSVRLS